MERMLAITSSGQLRPLTFHHAFRVHSQDVPIPEFRIVRRRKGALPMPNVLYRQPRFHVRQEIETVAIDGESACIHFNHGEVSTEEIDAAFQKVKKGGYSKLVIDMRNNSGHQFSALRLAAHLTEEPIKAGFLVGRNWYRMRDPDIDIRELDRKPVFSSSDKTNFFDILEDKSAVKLQIQPAGNAFIGKVYVLVNKGTGLMNEAVIHVLQEKGLVRVAGVATDGGVYALRSIPLSRDWQVDIPVADYLTPDGRRMNKEGLTPDITFDAYQSDITTLIESPSAWLN
jgi:C-terminal processing protease CtpA/Prc